MTGLWGRLFRPDRPATASSQGGSFRGTASQARPVHALASGRQRVEVVGTITWIGRRPTAGGAPSLVARLERLDNRVELVWLGRAALAGLTVGRRVRARGVLTNTRGRDTIFNPDYELVPDEKGSV